MSANGKLKVIVVGSGVAGSIVQKECSKYPDLFDFTLVSPTDFAELPPNLISHIFEKKDETFLSYYKKVVYLDTINRVKKHGKHIKQFATKVSEDKIVTLSDGTQIKGDVIVCATGLKLDEFWKPTTKVTTLDQRIDQLIQFRSNVAKAKSVLVIGGGVVAVEMAAELVTRHPGAEIHIAQGSDRLLPYQTSKLSKVAQNFLKNRNCKIHLSVNCVEKDGGYVLQSKGNEATLIDWNSKYSNGSKVFNPDVVVRCTGGKPVTDYLPANVKNVAGEAMVDEYLQINDMPGVFAIGDINNLKMVKTGQGAAAQAAYCFTNILAIAKNKSGKDTQLKKFSPPGVGVIVALGYWKGLMQFGDTSLVGPFGTGTNTMRFIRRAIEKSFHDSM